MHPTVKICIQVAGCTLNFEHWMSECWGFNAISAARAIFMANRTLDRYVRLDEFVHLPCAPQQGAHILKLCTLDFEYC